MKIKMNVRHWLITIFVLIGFVADRMLKIYFFQNPFLEIWRDFVLQFSFVKNFGIAFGIGVPKFLIMSAVILVLLFLSFMFDRAYREKDIQRQLSLAMIFVGAVSNLIDRVQYGYVIDYIHVKFFSVFNVADIFITLGAVLSFWNIMNKKTVSE